MGDWGQGGQERWGSVGRQTRQGRKQTTTN